MSLFVANLTKHNFQFLFWVERTSRPIAVDIAPGKQANIYPEGSRADHESIVNQHKIYGLVPVAEVDQKQGMVGQCYQFDKPIPLDRLFTTMTKNEDVLYDEAAERRKEATVAADDLMRRAAQETDSKIASFEVEIEEVEQKGVESQVHEVISVGEDKPQQQERRRGRPRRN